MAHDGELVAAEARELITGAQYARQPARGGCEQLVTGFVSEAVVHDLEVVDVENHQTDAGFVRCGPERGVQPLDEHHAVRQLGERVVTGTVRELRFDPAVLTHVVRGAHELFANSVRVDDRGHVHRDTTRRCRSPFGLERNRAQLPRRGREGAHVGDEGVGRNHVAEVAGGGVVREQRAIRVVRVDEPEDVVAVDRDREHRMRQEVEQRGVDDYIARNVGRGREGHLEDARDRHRTHRDPRFTAVRIARLPPCHVSAPRLSPRLSASQSAT